MDDDVIKKLRDVIKEEVVASEKRLENNLKTSLKVELAQVIKEEVVASEQRLKAKIKQLGDDIGDLISEQILPQIAEKADKFDIERLERKLDGVMDKNNEQDRRLDRIESVSVVAFELKRPGKH